MGDVLCFSLKVSLFRQYIFSYPWHVCMLSLTLILNQIWGSSWVVQQCGYLIKHEKCSHLCHLLQSHLLNYVSHKQCPKLSSLSRASLFFFFFADVACLWWLHLILIGCSCGSWSVTTEGWLLLSTWQCYMDPFILKSKLMEQAHSWEPYSSNVRENE